jgi:hypothetical protein
MYIVRGCLRVHVSVRLFHDICLHFAKEQPEKSRRLRIISGVMIMPYVSLQERYVDSLFIRLSVSERDIRDDKYPTFHGIRI